MGLALRGEKRGGGIVGRVARVDAPPIQTAWVVDEAGLQAMKVEWNALFAACERPSPCASHAWVSAWWEAFGRNPDGVGRHSKLAVMAFRDEEGGLVGVAPFYQERPLCVLAARRLRLIGHAWRHGVFDMTEEPTLLVKPDWEERVVRSAAAELRMGLERGRWDAANVRTYGVPLEGAMGGLSRIALTKIDARGGSDYASLPENWEAYRKAMTRSMRDNLPYYPRLLTRDGHDWSVRLLRDLDDMPAAAARLAKLHRTRAECAKGKRHDAHVHGPVQETFLSTLLQRLAEESNATVAELVVNGEVVASQCFVESGGTMMVYYSGYREEFYKYSPIFVLDSVVFKDALERGVRHLNFLRGPAAWKTRWLAQPGPEMHRAVFVSRRPASLARYALFWLGEAYGRNVSGKAPVLARQAATQARRWQATLQRALLPLLPVAGRLTLRYAPTVHLALAHHR